MSSRLDRPDYGVDAPAVLRNFYLIGAGCLTLSAVIPQHLQIGHVDFVLRPTFVVAGLLFLLEGFLYLHYVKRGKFKHRDRMLDLHHWSGNEQVLDVGCGRGLLLAGAARRILALNGDGKVTGIDVWSQEDMGENSETATLRNLDLEGVRSLCDVLGMPAQQMTFQSASFDLVVSNLCLHNIYDVDTRRLALNQIARVLKPGGLALISDYKLTGEYARHFASRGLVVERRWGSPFHTFPPLRIVVARKPAS